ncbi:MAG: hypothetical protein ABWY04_09470 [Arthrobacter sp.]
MGDLNAQQLKLLERFVLRARIVQDHSLARDIGVLRKQADTTFKFVFTRNPATGETSGKLKPVDLIPTEQLESAAARVRPIFLKSDKVHYESVLDTVNTALKGRSGASDLMAKAKALRSSFRQADPDYPSGKPESDWDGSALSNKQLSGAWLYGHLLHDDAVRRSYSGLMPLEEIYLSAMRTVCSEVLTTVETLHLIELLQVKGWLELSESLFTDEVTVTATSWVQPGEVRAFTAPVGTALPDNFGMDDLESHGWKDAAVELLPRTNETRIGP